MKFKAISFALVGMVNTFIDFGVFSFAWLILGLSPLLANVVAWFVATSGSYFMNCFTTFAAESWTQGVAADIHGLRWCRRRGSDVRYRHPPRREDVRPRSCCQVLGDRSQLRPKFFGVLFVGFCSQDRSVLGRVTSRSRQSRPRHSKRRPPRGRPSSLFELARFLKTRSKTKLHSFVLRAVPSSRDPKGPTSTARIAQLRR